MSWLTSFFKSGYSTVQQAGTPLPGEPILNFGSGATVADDAGRTTVTISALPAPAIVANAVVQMPLGAPPVSAPLNGDQILAAYGCTMSGGGTTDLGSSVVTPAFTATYVRTPTTAVLTDTDGSDPLNVHATPTAFSSVGTFTKSTFGQAVTFTLTASDGGVAKTSSVSWTWLNRAYVGSGTAGQTGSTFIRSLSSHLQAVRADNQTVAGANLKIYYATRSAFGIPTFQIGGIPGGMTRTQTAVSVANANSVSENYDLWESDYAQPTISLVVT